MADWPYNTAAWARLRRLKLDEEPDCAPCRERGRLTIANTVDHNVPINAGGPAFPATTGLTSMCTSCHSAKTARGVEAGGARTERAVQPRKGCDVDGNPLDPDHPWHGKSLKAGADRTALGSQTQLVRFRGRRRG